MKTAPANDSGGIPLSLSPLAGRKPYRSPRLTKLSLGQAKAIVAERTLAGDLGLEAYFPLLSRAIPSDNRLR